MTPQFQPKDGLIVESDPLTLAIDDDKLVKIIDKRISQSRAWYEKEKDLYKRQKRNEDYLFGRQIDESMLKDYNARYIDNVIWEAESTIKPIALSKMPDLVVKPINETPMAKDIARKVSRVVDADIRLRANRRVLGVAFRHIPAYFIGALKCRWDPEKGKDGDYTFELVHPNNLILDHTATTTDPADMDYVAQILELSVKEVLMRFPKKKDDLLDELENFPKDTRSEDLKDERKLASKIKVYEVWFTWYEDAGEGEFTRVEGVVWKYKKVILKKIKNPYWDWDGEARPIAFDPENKPQAAKEPDMRQAMMSQLMGGPDPLQMEKEYHNHFDSPQKPFILLGYDQWGAMPYDETSRIEQARLLQDNVNVRGRQITEMANRARGKAVFSTDSGLTKQKLEDVDMEDPSTDLIVQGKVGEVFTRIDGEQPSEALFQDQEQNRNRIFDIMGVHDTTRGKPGTKTAKAAQLLQQQDFGRIDDLTEDTINYAAEKMANWAMQFIKLFYTQAHFRRLLGKDGESVTIEIKRDMIQDGMEVVVSASGVDKMLRKRTAMEMAKMKLIDPLTFFEDMDFANPKERTERLMRLQLSPADYLAKYVMGMENPLQMATALNGPQQLPGAPQPPEMPPPPGGAPPAPMAGQGPLGGVAAQPPQPQPFQGGLGKV